MTSAGQKSGPGPNRNYTCGCCLEPVNDITEACDLCSEATGTLDGIGWRIRYCPTHAAAPEMLEALRPLAALADYYSDTEDSGPVFVQRGRGSTEAPLRLTGADCHRARAAICTATEGMKLLPSTGVCDCGHLRAEHDPDGRGPCGEEDCDCTKFDKAPQ